MGKVTILESSDDTPTAFDSPGAAFRSVSSRRPSEPSPEPDAAPAASGSDSQPTPEGSKTKR
jgi:hypothetical protein